MLVDPLVTMPSTIAPDVVILDTRDLLIRFDGSFMAEMGSGIGVSLLHWDIVIHQLILLPFLFPRHPRMLKELKFWVQCLLH